MMLRRHFRLFRCRCCRFFATPCCCHFIAADVAIFFFALLFAAFHYDAADLPRLIFAFFSLSIFFADIFADYAPAAPFFDMPAAAPSALMLLISLSPLMPPTMMLQLC